MKSVHALRPSPVRLTPSRLAVNAIVLVVTLTLGLFIGGGSWFWDRPVGSAGPATKTVFEAVNSAGGLASSEAGGRFAPASLPASNEFGSTLPGESLESTSRSGAEITVSRAVLQEHLGSAAHPVQSGSESIEIPNDDNASVYAAWDRLEQRIAAGIKRARDSVVALEYTPGDAAPGTRRLATGVVINHRGDVLSVRIDRPAATSAGGDNPATIIARDAAGRRHGVRWIASDAHTGLTLLRISSRALKPIRASKEEPELGSQVFVVGNPFGMEHSVSRGHIAGLERTLELGSRPLGGLIQIQTPLYPGDSGAVVVNPRGEWLGMIRSGLAVPATSGALCPEAAPAHPIGTARPVSAGTSESVIASEPADGRPDPDNGFGFAISTRDALWVAEQLRRDGRVNRAYLGVRLDLGGNDRLDPTPAPSVSADVSAPSANGSNADVVAAWSPGDPRTSTVMPPARDGAIVREVLPETPAAVCGLRAGDSIVRLDGMPIHSAHDLTDRLDHISTGTTIRLIVMRSQGVKTDRVELSLETASRPPTPIRALGSPEAEPSSTVTPMASASRPGAHPSISANRPESPSSSSTHATARDSSIVPETLRQTLPPEILRRLRELETRLEKLERPPASSR
jgi:S1-C subfamily serine protease